MKFTVRIGSEEKRVEVLEKNGVFQVKIDGKVHNVDCINFGHRDYLSLLINNQCYLVESAPVDANEGKYYAVVMGRHYDLEVLDELLLAARSAQDNSKESGICTVSSPMPGLIIDVKVEKGDFVQAGSSVVVMEAMKMRNEIITEIDGIVKEIYVKANQAVDSKAPLVTIETKR